MANWEKFSRTARNRWRWLGKKMLWFICYNFDCAVNISRCKVKLNYLKKYPKSCLLDLNKSFGILNLVHQVFINEISHEELRVVRSLILQLVWKLLVREWKGNVSFSSKCRPLSVSRSQYFLLFFCKIRTWSMALVVRLVITQDCRERHGSRRCAGC